MRRFAEFMRDEFWVVAGLLALGSLPYVLCVLFGLPGDR